jgi:hypothetical protein
LGRTATKRRVESNFTLSTRYNAIHLSRHFGF